MSVEQVTVFESNGDEPDDVADEVRELWSDAEFGNDNYYYSWDSSNDWDDDTEKYPAIAAYLKSLGIEKCLIHYWW